MSDEKDTRRYLEIDTEGTGGIVVTVEPEIYEKLINDTQYRSSFTQALKLEEPTADHEVPIPEQSTSKNKVTKSHWSGKEAEMLVALRIEMDLKFQMCKVHRTLWEEIAQQMSKQGYNVTGTHCSNKWKSIKRDYKSVVDHNAKSGNGPQKKCKFYDDLNELFGNKPSTRPLHTIETMEDESTTDEPRPGCSGSSDSSINSVSTPVSTSPDSINIPDVPANTSATVSDSDSELPELCKLRKRKMSHKNLTVKKNKKSHQDKMIEWMEKYKEAQQEMQQKQMEFQKKQEQERLNRMDRFLDILSAGTHFKDNK